MNKLNKPPSTDRNFFPEGSGGFNKKNDFLFSDDINKWMGKKKKYERKKK